MRAWIWGLLVSTCLFAERLPIRTLTSDDGLSSNTIKKIVADSRGFLWFCTGQGLSRFDGYRFVNFGDAQGLPGPVVWDIAETTSGDYWVATSGGLARLPNSSRERIEVLKPGDVGSPAVFALRASADGTLWVGAETGLYRLRNGSHRLDRIDLGALPERWNEPAVTAVEEDRNANIWFGGYAGIGRIRRDGHVDRWTPRTGFASYVVVALHLDHDGVLWAGTERGLCRIRSEPRPNESPSDRCYGRKDGLPSSYVQAILQTTAGKLWVGTLDGAAYAVPDGARPLRFTPVTTRQGLSHNNIEALAEDRRGNVWLGSSDDGVMQLSAENVVLFTAVDGLADPNAVAVFEDQAGHIIAVTRSDSNLAIHRFEEGRFRRLAVPFLDRVRLFGRGLQQIALQDRCREWWLATGEGLLQFPAAGDETLRSRPRVHVGPAGPDGANVLALYEDSRGDVWWSASSRILSTLGRWDRASRRMRFFTEADGLPSQRGVSAASAFVEDNRGALWIGFEREGVARQRSDGRLEYFDQNHGGPRGRIRSAFRDLKGRLWFASQTGLWRLDDPSAPQPVFRAYTSVEGMSSTVVQTVIGDVQGRIYAATEKGIDRLDPDSGAVERFSTADGFPAGSVQSAHLDRRGNLWLATRHGIVRLVPQSLRVSTPPPSVLITSIRVKGIDRPIGAGGEASLGGLEFPFEETPIEFGFSAPQVRSSGDLPLEYRLEGARSGRWTRVTDTRSVNFASLRPGSYTFQVRARGAQASTVSFRVLPPFWATWWFRLAALLSGAALIVLFYRYRMRAAVEREHLRTRIATDLHDDIGASLSRIAIWSEVAAREAGPTSAPVTRALTQIGDVSREVIASMSDIVWAVNPQYDSFNDLATRMRRYVSDLSSAANLFIAFEIAGEHREAQVGPAVRREIFLIFKEALHNVLRHAQCSQCGATLSLDSRSIVLRVIDNGQGFDPRAPKHGHGLDSMKSRAMRLGGTLLVDTSPGSGVRIEARVPRQAPVRGKRPRPTLLHK